MLGTSLAEMTTALETLSSQIKEERAKLQIFPFMSECACVFTVRTAQNLG